MKKIIKIFDLKIIRQKFKKKEIGLVHGVFDYFHFGHLLHIEKAKSLCDVLIVSLIETLQCRFSGSTWIVSRVSGHSTLFNSDVKSP